jgi:exodeoxyribonuclease VII small subunit
MSVKKEKSFEESLRRLEHIVEALDSGDVALDDAIKMYEEGIALSKACSEKLTSAELKLKKLSKDMQGAFHLVDEEETSEE